ncbi:MAG: penicillin-binding transpeptidase domain-containing protein [Myxococcota bacterium]
MRSQALDKASRRIVWVRFAGLAVVVILAGRAAHLTVAHARARDLYDQQIQTKQRLAPARGTIVDREGKELAVTIESASIYAVPRLLEDREGTAQKLAKALDADPVRLTSRLTKHDGFTYLARWVDPEKVERVKALEIDGIGIDPEPRRSYPAGKLAAPLIGFANLDGKGVRGVEQIENAWLTGKPRSVRVERDARGRKLALSSTDPREAQGGEIALTLDMAMQGAAEAALAEALVKYEAKGGYIITLDPKTGDILALAEGPGFDPNHFRTLNYRDTRARAFTDVMEAGSTMKAFLVASALDAGVITPYDSFDTGEGFLRVRGKTIRDRKPFGVLSPADVLRVSSNVGAVQIAQRVGREEQYQGLLRFGFGASTGSGFPMESGGLVRDWNAWKPVDQAAISFGQGISVTPIQLASALGALANDGERMQPRLVLARRRAGEDWQPAPIRSHGYAVSKTAARQTLDMMQTVVSGHGTARNAGLKDVGVAGKTGTAQKLDRDLGRYSQERYMAWFMGVVPADDPELAIIVAIDEPMGRLHSGGGVAAPIFARVAADQLGRRGIVTEPQPIKTPPPAPEVLLVDAAGNESGNDATTQAGPSDEPGNAGNMQSPDAPIAAAPAPRVEEEILSASIDAAPIESPALMDATDLPIAAAAPAEVEQEETASPEVDLRAESEAELAALSENAEQETDLENYVPQSAAVAAPPARPAADQAAGPPPVAAGPEAESEPLLEAQFSATVQAATRGAVPEIPVFVPDFSGQTIAHAQRIAENEALEITILGAIEGRVVSQIPVPGTVLVGADRTVRLRFESRPSREEG